MKFQIKYGESTNLIQDGIVQIQLEEGCWYLTTDTHMVYVAMGGELVPLNDAESFDPTEINNNINTLQGKVATLEADIQTLSDKEHVIQVATRSELPSVGKENIVYIVVGENATYRWSSNDIKYYSVGRDYEEIQVIHGGSAEELTDNLN